MIEESDQIGALLDSYHVETLLHMASVAELPVALRRPRPKKALLMDRLQALFFTEERVLASLARLNKRDRAVLDRLVLRGGSAPTPLFKRELLRAGLATDGLAEDGNAPALNGMAGYLPYAEGPYIGRPERAHSAVFEDVMARLTAQGLVFSRLAPERFSYGPPPKLQFHPADEVFIPEIILPWLPAPQPAAGYAPVEPARVQQAEPALLLRDLYLYWDYCRRNPVSVTRSGYVGKRGLRAINDILLAPDPLLAEARNEAETGRLARLGDLLRESGWLVVSDGLLRPEPAQLYPVPEVWSRPETELLAGLLGTWPALAGKLEVDSETRRYGAVPEMGCRTLMRALSGAPVGIWLDPLEVLERARSLERGLLFPERGRAEAMPGSAYFVQAGFYGRAGDLLSHFDRLEERFVQRCLTGFLHEAGVVDLGFDGEALAAVRVTALGHELLARAQGEAKGGPGDAPAADEGRVVVQPSFQVLALGPVSLAVLAHLDLMADRQRAGQGAFEYQLTRESVYRAQQAGMDAGAVTLYLEAVSAVELPRNVRRSLEEWALHHERIVFRSGVSLVQTVAPELLAALREDPETGRLIARSAGPQVAILQNDAAAALVPLLVARGQFPTVCGAQPRSADHSVTIEADGTVRPIHAVPSLFLFGRLQRLADPDVGGVWRLTPGSIARAGGSKARVLRLLEELARLHRGALPEALLEKVKAWGGYYGDAAAQTVTLIEFRDPATLAELCENPALSDLLTPFPAGERALAVVAEERLAQVRAILAGLGVRVREGLPHRP